jgi:FMN-dependent NADH-azoreductase
MPDTILYINSRLLGDRSMSRKPTAKILDELTSKHPNSKEMDILPGLE